jgi:hypothetical protein
MAGNVQFGGQMRSLAMSAKAIEGDTSKIGQEAQTLSDGLKGTELATLKGSMAIKNLNFLMEYISGIFGGRYKALGAAARLASG